MNRTVRFGNCFLKDPLLYQPSAKASQGNLQKIVYQTYCTYTVVHFVSVVNYPHFYLSRRHQPRLGVGHHHTPYLFEDDPGIMSEVETSSTRFRRPSGNPASSGGGLSGKVTRSSHSREGHSNTSGMRRSEV